MSRHSSFSEFTFYASGRQNMFYALLKLDMLRRHCMLSTLVTERIQSAQDTLTVDIPIHFPGDFKAPAPVPLEFYVCQNKNVKGALQSTENFAKFVTQVKADHLPVPKPPVNLKDKKEMAAYKKSKHLVVLAESDEAANFLIDTSIGEVLQKHGDCLMDMHITDQEVYNKYKMFLRARIHIGTTDKEHESAIKVLETIFKIVDKVTRLQLSPSNFTKAERVRRKVEATKKKEDDEKLEAAKIEKKREEEKKFKEQWASLSREEQIKLEEKKRQKELKEQKKKLTKMVKH